MFALSIGRRYEGPYSAEARSAAQPGAAVSDPTAPELDRQVAARIRLASGSRREPVADVRVQRVDGGVQSRSQSALRRPGHAYLNTVRTGSNPFRIRSVLQGVGRVSGQVLQLSTVIGCSLRRYVAQWTALSARGNGPCPLGQARQRAEVWCCAGPIPVTERDFPVTITSQCRSAGRDPPQSGQRERSPGFWLAAWTGLGWRRRHVPPGPMGGARRARPRLARYRPCRRPQTRQPLVPAGARSRVPCRWRAANAQAPGTCPRHRLLLRGDVVTLAGWPSDLGRDVSCSLTSPRWFR
jgi:hypothetical protein